MAAIHSATTKPELKLRLALWRLGIRYLVNEKRLPGKPDIVLPKYRTAIFVHGCFWHGHKNCKNASTPKTNTEFWTAKITRNQQRDQEVWRHPTNPVSYERPHVFMVNYAIGGGSGWYIDLERYGNASDMFVDYVRVFTKSE